MGLSNRLDGENGVSPIRHQPKAEQLVQKTQASRSAVFSVNCVPFFEYMLPFWHLVQVTLLYYKERSTASIYF
jgi:hypothetical protein